MRRHLVVSRYLAIMTLGFAAISSLPAQQATQSAPHVPTVTFTLDFPNSNPAHYSIAVEANGHARYECMGTVAADSEAQPYEAEFEMSPANRERIFQWAKQAKYFEGNIDSGNSKLASTGEKVLSYEDDGHSNRARYNYSNLEAVRDLTTLFQKMATTLDYGRRLTYFHHYQKLALDEELKRMETQARNGELSEIQSVQPVLQEILDDSSVINVVRARAKELEQMANAPASAHR